VTARRLPLPTDAELQILRVLWARGASTVRAVQSALGGAERTGYTTVLKLLQVMHGKRLVRRDERERTHIYEATVLAEDTQRRLVSDLAERAFGGSAAHLAMRALSSSPASTEELRAVRALLDRLEREGDA